MTVKTAKNGKIQASGASEQVILRRMEPQVVLCSQCASLAPGDAYAIRSRLPNLVVMLLCDNCYDLQGEKVAPLCLSCSPYLNETSEKSVRHE